MKSSFQRKLQLKFGDNRACFLWGPRKTGKSTLVRQQFPQATTFDLLDSSLKNRLLIHPTLLREIILQENPEYVFVDEVQKVPELLDEIHWCIENTNSRFILCGSSARKLKRGAANLLGGRAWRYILHPLTSQEIGKVDLLRACNHGLLPQHYLSSDKGVDKFLTAYVADYLNEEIQAEALVRSLPSFARFLQAATFSHGELINYANIASDCGVSAKTVMSYYQILEDTLLGFRLPAWRKSKKRRMITTDKFYLFDVGVVKNLKGLALIQDKTEEFGQAFEHFMLMEIMAYLSYSDKNKTPCFWRSTSGFEVDLIIGNEIAIEFKAAHEVKTKHLRGLKAFLEENKVKHAIIVSLDKYPRLIEGISVTPWDIFCKKLWEGHWF